MASRSVNYSFIFKALSNESRMEIIGLLRGGPRTVGEISRHLRHEQSRVSHNLKCLVDCGFLVAERRGKSRVYSLNKETLEPLLKLMDRHIKGNRECLVECGFLKE